MIQVLRLVYENSLPRYSTSLLAVNKEIVDYFREGPGICSHDRDLIRPQLLSYAETLNGFPRERVLDIALEHCSMAFVDQLLQRGYPGSDESMLWAARRCDPHLVQKLFWAGMHVPDKLAIECSGWASRDFCEWLSSIHVAFTEECYNAALRAGNLSMVYWLNLQHSRYEMP